VLRREEALRMSPEQQALFGSVEHRYDIDWIDLADALQRRVVQEFGDGGDPERALALMRTATTRFPHDAEMASISVYHRANRVRRGTLRVGDPLPDMQLADMQGAATTLHAHKRPGRPLFVVAGSWT
jgi:hypothetical protein